MNLIKKIENELENCLDKLGYSNEKVVLNISSRPEIGEYQYNGAMSLAKRVNIPLMELANSICKEFSTLPFFEDVNVTNPGFINFTISKESKIAFLNQLIESNEFVDTLPKKKIFIDYGGPNVAKVLHVGHLRSANIGESLKRLAKLLGHEVICDVHLGDYGLQMGMILLEIKSRFPNLKCFDVNFKGEMENIPIDCNDLIELYPIASKKAKENEQYMNEARMITYELQSGHRGYNALWKKIVEISISDIKRIYKRLNVSFDLWEGESDAAKYYNELNDYLEKNNYIEDSLGAKVIRFDDNIPPLLLVKSNKALSYEATDLATIWERKKIYSPDEIWYVVDKRQSLHFKQVFLAAKKTRIIDDDTKLEFIGFGTMNSSDGKPFKTRDGGVMSLDELISIVKDETSKNVKETIVDEEREDAVEKIAIGTLKFADLLSSRTTDYIFDPIKFSESTGKTAPFVMYTTIRIESLLTKAKNKEFTFNKIYSINDDLENQIVLNILNLQKVLENSFNNRSLNEITDFLYQIDNSFNNLYSNSHFLNEKDSYQRETWLSLSYIVKEINIMLLNVLAISLPPRM